MADIAPGGYSAAAPPPDPASSMGDTTDRTLPRTETRRLVAGRGRFTGDLAAPRLLHAVFLRSPVAHGRIVALDGSAARALPGVAAVLTAGDLRPVCKAMITRSATVPEHRPPPQPALADGSVHYQGEPVALAVADSPDRARDAAEAIRLEIEELPPASDYADPAVRDRKAHPASDSNLMLQRSFGEAGPAPAARRRFVFERQTGVPLEGRAVLADYDPAAGSLTVFQSGQVPHQMQQVWADLLGLPLHRVRVVCPDVGGAFGIKLHAYADELAVVAASRLLGRPVKWAADRLESFPSDVHAREFTIDAGLETGRDGRVVAFDATMENGAGAYSVHPRGSAGEASLTAALIGAACTAERAHVAAAVRAQNKAPTGAYRGVGQPVAMAVSEVLIDDTAWRLGLDPLEVRRRNYPADGSGFTSAGGVRADALSFHACLDRLEALMDYPALRAAQAAARKAGGIEGIGVATLVELTAPGAGVYGAQEIDATAEDTATVAMLPSGAVRVQVGCTDQGQGTLTGVGQLVAERLGLAPEDVAVAAGDSDGPVGGGAWASRGLSIGGTAAWRAADAVAGRLLEIAGTLLQEEAANLTLAGGEVCDRTGAARLTVAEIAKIAHYRQHLLPPEISTDLNATRSFVPRTAPFYAANGIQACHLAVDPETGAIDLLRHWVVEDCGRVVNPALVDGQIIGGVVQGLGAALMERCVYDGDGNLLTGSLMDYALPRADWAPPILIDHVETPQPGTETGVKGAGEAGVVGAIAAVWCAVNDALRPFGAQATVQPFTPERMLRALRGGTAV